MSTGSLAGGDMDWTRAKTALIPDDQLQLTETVLLNFPLLLTITYRM